MDRSLSKKTVARGWSAVWLLAMACAGGGGGEGEADCTVLAGRIAGLNSSIAEVSAQATALKASVAGACAAIAGQSAPANPTDDQVGELCNAAQVAIDAQLNAGLDVQVVIIPPVCEVNVQAQVDCEAQCYAEAQVQCDPGDVQVRCEPGDLSVVCEGTCEVGATCQGSVDVAVTCNATCDGKCNGTCDGNCSAEVMNANGQAECAGNCDGTCSGTCNGSCDVTAMGGVECGAMARCKGGCSVEGSAPRCEAQLRPPACEAMAQVDCSGACDATGTLNATCDRDDVEVQVVVDGDAEFAATLEAQLPALVLAARQGTLALGSVGDLADQIRATGSAATSCGIGVALQFAASVSAAVQATASVSVSFQASASVSASVTGQGGAG